jgi:hypothetical protein
MLAPVPIRHLPDAVSTEQLNGRVAFGSNSFELLDRLSKDGSIGVLHVYIVASKTGFRSTDELQAEFLIGKVQLRGTLTAVTPAKQDRHPNPEIRPASALANDRSWGMFWEVSGLTRIDPPLPLSKFSTQTGKAWMKTPEGPVEAHLGS